MYLGLTEQELNCEADDNECIEEYRSLIDVYIILTCVILAVTFLILTVYCCSARRQHNQRKEVSSKEKKQELR